MGKKTNFLYVLVHAMFWCGYAVAWSYTAVYLKHCGYDNSIVGLVTGIGAVVSVILQPVLASITVKSKFLNNKMNIIILKIAATVLAVLVMQKMPGIYTVAVLFMLIAAIDASIPSILSSVAMDYVNAGVNVNYGLARGTGSILYAVFSLFLGYAVEWFGEGSLMLFYVAASVATIVITMIFPYDNSLKKQADNGDRAESSFVGLFKKYPFLAPFLVSAVLLFMGHNMVNVFLIDIIERAGGDSSNLGLALFIAAGVELPVMAGFVWLANKIKVDKLLVFSAVFFTVKNICTIFAVNMGLVYVVQFMQFGAFALFTPASVYFINKVMKPEDSGVGQALLGSCSLGLGGTLGNVLGGFVLEASGLMAMIIWTVVLSFIGIFFMVVSSRKSQTKVR